MTNLTDLEICKRIAEIEGYKTSVTDSKKGVWASVHKNECYDWYNPLTDDALCFQLMIKHKINVDACSDNAYYATGTDKDYNTICTDYCDSPNRAICLAIIEAHKC